MFFSLLSRRSQRVSVPITSIKSVKIMQAQGHHFLALRTCRPPLITESQAIDLMDMHASEERTFTTTIDPSSDAAFSSPTAHFCLHFASEHHFREALGALQAFKLHLRRDVIQVSTQASKLTTTSHFLPDTSSLARSLKGLSDRDSFGVQYSLECLIKHCLLRSEDVCHLLDRLRNLYQWGESDTPMNELDILVDKYPPVHRCNTGCEAYTEVRSTGSSCVHHGMMYKAAGFLITVFLSVQVLDFHKRCASIQYYSQGSLNGAAALRGGPTAMADSSNSHVQLSDDEEEDYSESESDDDGPTRRGLLYLKKVLITPLRVLPYPATPEESSRILRQCAPHSMKATASSASCCSFSIFRNRVIGAAMNDGTLMPPQ